MTDRTPDDPHDPALPPADVVADDVDAGADGAVEVPDPADSAAATDGPVEPPRGSASPSPGRRVAAWVGAAALALAAFLGGLAVGHSSSDDDGPSHRGEMSQNGPRGGWHNEDNDNSDNDDEQDEGRPQRPPRPEQGDQRSGSGSDRSDS